MCLKLFRHVYGRACLILEVLDQPVYPAHYRLLSTGVYSTANQSSRVGVSSPHLRMETYPVSETFSFLVFRIPADRQSPETQSK
jgi:hypothetical protein